MQNPYYAYGYAYFIDKESRENTMPHAKILYAYFYERYRQTPKRRYPRSSMQRSRKCILLCKTWDKEPREDTRKAACENSEFAYFYAFDIDKCPREITRNAACKDPKCAYLYAKDIDKGFHEDTWKAIKGTKYEEKYMKLLNNSIKELIIWPQKIYK